MVRSCARGGVPRNELVEFWGSRGGVPKNELVEFLGVSRYVTERALHLPDTQKFEDVFAQKNTCPGQVFFCAV